MKHSEIIVRLEKIQTHALRMLNSSPSLVEVQNFAEYSNILKSLLEKHIKEEKLKKWIEEIPYIDWDEKPKISFIQLNFIFRILFYQTTRIRKIQNQIKLAKDKYNEIEILLRGSDHS